MCWIKQATSERKMEGGKCSGGGTDPCLLLQQEASPHEGLQQLSPGPERGGGVWLQGDTCHHLHSTATVFCAGEAEDGLMPVSEDPDDVDTVVLDTERADG